MRPVKFTQYKRPDGRAVEQTIDRPDDIAQLADDLATRGIRLTVEVLTTGEVSLAAEHIDWGDIVIQLVENGPGLPDKVDMMIREAHEFVFSKRRHA